MDHNKKLQFIAHMTRMGLDHIQHYDQGGGTTLSGPTVAGQTANTNTGGVLGGINSVLGLNNQFQGQYAPIQAGTNAGQLNTAYTGTQGALANQNNLVAQTQPGVAQGLGSESTLANQFAQEAAGAGPNPAQAALSQSTGQNVANQAALMAGQRGASANAGLLARQAGQQGAATQQQAVGQAATLEAQQQIAAQQNAANLANTQVNQGAAAVQNQNQQQQNEQNILQGANTSLNNANVAMQSNVNSANAQAAAANQQSNSNLFGGVLNGASSVLGFLAEGGEVDHAAKIKSTYARYKNRPMKKMAEEGQADAPPAFQPTPSDVSSSGGGGGGGGGGGMGGLLALLAQGGPVGGGYMAKMAAGGKMDYRSGGSVKADGKDEKATVPGDDYKNDKVPALLSEKEVVIDRDTLADKGPIGQMARAVAKAIEQRNKAKGVKR